MSRCLLSFGAKGCIQWCMFVYTVCPTLFGLSDYSLYILFSFLWIIHFLWQSFFACSLRHADELFLFIFSHIGTFFFSSSPGHFFFLRGREDWQSVGSLHRLHIKRPLIKQSLRGSEVSCSNTINYYWHLRGWAGLHEDMLFTVLCMLGFKMRQVSLALLVAHCDYSDWGKEK